MSNNTGRWIPANLDGSAHRCGERKESVTIRNLLKTSDKQPDMITIPRSELEGLVKTARRLLESEMQK